MLSRTSDPSGTLYETSSHTGPPRTRTSELLAVWFESVDEHVSPGSTVQGNNAAAAHSSRLAGPRSSVSHWTSTSILALKPSSRTDRYPKQEAPKKGHPQRHLDCKLVRETSPLRGGGSPILHAKNAMAGTSSTTGAHSRRMLKKAVQRGRSE